LRAFGATIGRKCLICGGVRIWEPWNLFVGDYAAIGDNAEIYNLAPVTIGSNSIVSQGVYLCTATHDYLDPFFSLISREIIIRDSVWIAAKVFVCPGVTVEEGAVVGACSIVTKNVPAWTIAAGNPCRPIKGRTLKKALN
jgi:putative colanic acid biosynthesis acetyltransferase WcaF